MKNDVHSKFGTYLSRDDWRNLSKDELCKWLRERLGNLTREQDDRLLSALDRKDELLCCQPRVSRADFQPGDGVVLFAFGIGVGRNGRPDVNAIGYDREKHHPGVSNDGQAEWLLKVNDAKQLVVCAQIEVADSLAKYNLILPRERVAGPKEGVYLNTSGVAEFLAPSLRNCPTIWVTSVAAHAPRCAATLLGILRRCGSSAEVKIPDYVVHIPYDPLSSQPWTTRFDVYAPHEILARYKGIIFGAHTVDDLLLFCARDAHDETR